MFDSNLIVLKLLGCFSQPIIILFVLEAIWVQLHNLPVLCMNKQFGVLIGASIGKVLEVDAEADDTG